MSDLVKYYRQLVGIAKSWSEKNLPHWDDEIHRDLLTRHGAVVMNGRVSASTMNVPQLAQCLMIMSVVAGRVVDRFLPEIMSPKKCRPALR